MSFEPGRRALVGRLPHPSTRYRCPPAFSPSDALLPFACLPANTHTQPFAYRPRRHSSNRVPSAQYSTSMRVRVPLALAGITMWPFYVQDRQTTDRRQTDAILLTVLVSCCVELRHHRRRGLRSIFHKGEEHRPQMPMPRTARHSVCHVETSHLQLGALAPELCFLHRFMLPRPFFPVSASFFWS